MKISRSKLNTLLRSGLNPEIKTRKQLAAQLDLDPTSLTRWFATRDRLGNPRYPVVPDRHISNILRVFNLEPQCFNLGDEEFHQYCFELANQRLDESLGADKKLLSREDKIARRRLTIPVYPKRRYKNVTISGIAIVTMASLGWGVFNWQQQSPVTVVESAATEVNCWTGYPASLGTFNEVDSSDPCHYRKLLHKAVEQLKADNLRETATSEAMTMDTSGDYIKFLSSRLDQQRRLEKGILNLELGKSELKRANYGSALEYFKIAKQELSSLSDPVPGIVEELNNHFLLASQKLSDISQDKSK